MNPSETLLIRSGQGKHPLSSMGLRLPLPTERHQAGNYRIKKMQLIQDVNNEETLSRDEGIYGNFLFNFPAKLKHARMHTHTHTHIIYVYIKHYHYICSIYISETLNTVITEVA
jgi:hypothetical protein